MAEKLREVEVVADGATVFHAVDFEQVGFVSGLDALFQFGHDEMVFRVGGDGRLAWLEDGQLVAQDAFFILRHEPRHDDGVDAVCLFLQRLHILRALVVDDVDHFVKTAVSRHIGILRQDDEIDGACGNGGETACLPVQCLLHFMVQRVRRLEYGCFHSDFF